jgi:hypothetical protein
MTKPEIFAVFVYLILDLHIFLWAEKRSLGSEAPFTNSYLLKRNQFLPPYKKYNKNAVFPARGLKPHV